ncbi:MAG: hypothetical protein GEU93_04160 [Propionibacteriales bacterium]|nr:hypothetical protein [Propionibacteriales bacterium]
MSEMNGSAATRTASDGQVYRMAVFVGMLELAKHTAESAARLAEVVTRADSLVQTNTGELSTSAEFENRVRNAYLLASSAANRAEGAWSVLVSAAEELRRVESGGECS